MRIFELDHFTFCAGSNAARSKADEMGNIGPQMFGIAQRGFMMSENPKFFYRIGPPMHVVHVTQERTLSVFAVRSDNDALNLFLTFDAR